MSISDKKLPFSGNAILLEKLAINYTKFVDGDAAEIPRQQIYKVNCTDESPMILRTARKAALSNFNGFTKIAFDVRRIDQEMDRNPRTNLQYWQRSDQFIDANDQKNIDILAKLIIPLNELKQSFGAEPGWHESYSRQLLDQVERALRVKIGDQDLYRPQFAYLEQLIFQRYRLSFEEITRMNKSALKQRILDKDENLLKRGAYMHATMGEADLNKQSAQQLALKTGDNNSNTQEALIKAIFGNNEIRKPGEKSSTRTITITIKDEAE